MVPATVNGTGSKTGRGGDDDPGVLRKALNEGAFVCEPQIGGEIQDIASLPMDGDGKLATTQFELNHFLTHQAAPFRGQFISCLKIALSPLDSDHSIFLTLPSIGMREKAS
jgi:hypothetical protein